MTHTARNAQEKEVGAPASSQAPSPKNCQAFPPRYESVPPHSTTLPHPTSPTNLADYIAQLGILKIGAKKSFPPRRDPKKGRRVRPFLLSERRSSMPASVPYAIAPEHDLGTAPRRLSPCCQACQQMQVPQNQLPVTCPLRKTQTAPTKGAQPAKPQALAAASLSHCRAERRNPKAAKDRSAAIRAERSRIPLRETMPMLSRLITGSKTCRINERPAVAPRGEGSVTYSSPAGITTAC